MAVLNGRLAKVTDEGEGLGAGGLRLRVGFREMMQIKQGWGVTALL